MVLVIEHLQRNIIRKTSWIPDLKPVIKYPNLNGGHTCVITMTQGINNSLPDSFFRVFWDNFTLGFAGNLVSLMGIPGDKSQCVVQLAQQRPLIRLFIQEINGFHALEPRTFQVGGNE